MLQLRHTIEELPQQLDGAAVNAGNREIIGRLNALTRDVHDLRQRPEIAASAASAEGGAVEVSQPERHRIELGDIQGMIDSLLKNS